MNKTWTHWSLFHNEFAEYCSNTKLTYNCTVGDDAGKFFSLLCVHVMHAINLWLVLSSPLITLNHHRERVQCM